MKCYAKYTSLVLFVCACTLLFSGCSKERTAVININTVVGESSSYTHSEPVMQGRTIKLGEDVKDNFGPSFDFDKLQ